MIVGAGAYPRAQQPTLKAPAFEHLTSVAPGVLHFAQALIRDWDPTMAAPLVSVELLLSDPGSPGGMKWSALGVEGETANDSAIDSPTMANLKDAVDRSLLGAKSSDHFLFFCCGHGFWRGGRHFVMSDFNSAARAPWETVLDLDNFLLGLQTEAPRTQWLFFDCCADVPAKVLEAFGAVGVPLIQGTAATIRAAEEAYGRLSQYCHPSAPVTHQAFGIKDAPSRFCEMLLEALGGSAAVEKDPANGTWWITERGIADAISSYSERNPALDTPKKRKFYEGAGVPIMPDASTKRMRFRKIAGKPKSKLVATSSPATALKESALAITWEGEDEPCWTQVPPGLNSRLLIDLEPRRTYLVAAKYGEMQKQVEIFTHLPFADPAEITYD